MTTSLDLSRGMPCSIEAEKTILGAILLDNEACLEAGQTLSRDDFYLDAHQRLFRAMCELSVEGLSIDIITLTDRLQTRKEVEAVGGSGYISSLIDGVPHQPTIEQYLAIVRDRSRSRQLLHDMSRAGVSLVERSDSFENVKSQLETDLLSLTDKGEKQQTTPEIIEAVVASILRRRSGEESPFGYKSGIQELDEMVYGYDCGNVTVIGGAPGYGKSATLAMMAAANCPEGVAVGIFTLEMTREQWMSRLISWVADVPFDVVRDPRWMTNEHLKAVQDASGKIATWQLFIDDTTNINLGQMMAKARLWTLRGVKLIGVDFLQLMSVPEAKDERVAMNIACKGIKHIAKSTRTALVVLSQLARPDRKGGVRRPRLQDFKESSAIEEMAATAILIHRQQGDNGAWLDQDELLIPKQRFGHSGFMVPVKFSNRIGYVYDPAPRDNA